ncbi:hypothetical protein DU490_15865 [Halomonas sp. DQ26W]|nr:hypothetical protein DU490_15865 [Halomonas sp. DQ26W]
MARYGKALTTSPDPAIRRARPNALTLLDAMAFDDFPLRDIAMVGPDLFVTHLGCVPTSGFTLLFG